MPLGLKSLRKFLQRRQHFEIKYRTQGHIGTTLSPSPKADILTFLRQFPMLSTINLES